MLRINNNQKRDLSKICRFHYIGLKDFVLNGISKSSLNKLIKAKIKGKLQVIISGNPESLLKVEQELYKYISSIGTNKKFADTQLKKIFKYTVFSQRKVNTKWNAYKLAKQLNIKTCVYCNRQYTFTIDEGNSKITRPQFDHFFSQKDHPLLALSFYNLIPCCSICNLRKHDKPFSLNRFFHPYLDGYGKEGVFTWIPKNYRAMIGRSDEMNIKILERVDVGKQARIKRQKNFFKLERIYTEHSDVVQEIILKAHISNQGYFKWLQKKFGGGVSEEDLYRLALGNYSDENQLDKRVLSKLTLDIAKELNLIA